MQSRYTEYNIKLSFMTLTMNLSTVAINKKKTKKTQQ